MLYIVGAIAIGGVSGTTYLLATRQPPSITLDELRDAGAVDLRVDRWVACGPEKITELTRRYLKRNGYGDFREGTVHRICRVVWEYVDDRAVNTQQADTLPDGDAGLIDVVRPCVGIEKTILDGGWCRTHWAVPPSLIVDLLRDAGEEVDLDGGDEDDTDNATGVRFDNHYRLECNDPGDAGLHELRLLPDGGLRHTRSDGGEATWCNSGTRRGRVVPPCVICNCWVAPDGGWVDDAVRDCQAAGPFGTHDGGPRFYGCNVLTAPQFAVGVDWTPAECTITSGDPIDVLR